MDRFTSMAVFVKSIETGSFAAAAEMLDISPQMVGKHVRELEHWVGAKLLNKTTRQQSLTEVGALFYERCKFLLAEVEATEAVTQELLAEPRGQLRIAAPLSFGHYQLVPLLSEFMDLYPHIQIDLHLSNRRVDIIEEGFDTAIRVITQGDEQLIAKRLQTQEFCLCASARYLERHGSPQHPAQLADHQCLHGNWGGSEIWEFQNQNEIHRVKISSRLKINNWPALLLAARHGAGITLQPRPLIEQDIANQQLIQVLPEYRVPTVDLSVLYPQDRQITLKLRRFIHFISEKMDQPR